jgi:hypothetical protein
LTRTLSNPLVPALAPAVAAGADPVTTTAAADPATTITATRAAPPTRRLTDGFIVPPGLMTDASAFPTRRRWNLRIHDFPAPEEVPPLRRSVSVGGDRLLLAVLRFDLDDREALADIDDLVDLGRMVGEDDEAVR